MVDTPRSRDRRRPAADVLRLAAALGQTPALVRQLTRPSGMSLTALAALSTLERLGGARVGELAESENVTQPAMTQFVSRMQAQGLVERHPDPDDRRVVVVRLTTEGRELVGHRRADRADALAERMMLLDDEDRASLLAALPALERLLAT